MSALSVEGLSVAITRSAVDVVRPLDLRVGESEILGVVGESGSGKTTLGLALLGYARRGLCIASGTVRVGNVDMLMLPERKVRLARGATISYVAQDPSAALNPALTIGRQLKETLDAHAFEATAEERDARVAETLHEVLLPEDRVFLKRYPHQLSGGQQQRLVLAMAFVCRPSVIVLDEPTTGLDVTTQAHVLETIRAMTKSHGTAAIYITHDLAVVATLADRIAVMYAGSIVEEGAASTIFEQPAHPYTARLIASIPRLEDRAVPAGIRGRAPSPGDQPPGCAFAPRCTMVEKRCTVALPEPVEVGERHRVRCVRATDALRAGASSFRPLPAKAKPTGSAELLTIRNLDAWYGDTEVLHSVDLGVHAGECVALVGESGSGKTTLARIVAGLHHQYHGEVLLDGTALAASARQRPAGTRKRVQYIFQNPYSSLNPRRTVGESIGRAVALTGPRGRAVRARATEMLERVSLSSDYIDRYPDQLSGGERQRVAIARALVADPSLLICDEVTSALDVSVQATIVELLTRLQRELDLSLLFVTHNLPLVRSIASRVAVLRAGTIVESGSVSMVIERPQSDYTQALIADTPSLGET